MAFSYWRTGNFGCGFRAPANQGDQGTQNNSGFGGYGYQLYAPYSYGREGWNKWVFSASCLRSFVLVASQLTDNFDDNSTDAFKWTIVGWRISTTTTGGTTSEANHRLECTASTSDNQGAGYVSGAYDLTGGSFFVKPTLATAIDANQEFFLAAGPDQSNYVRMVYFNGSLYCQKVVANAFTTHTSVAYSSTTHAWWRIRHGGAGDDTIYFDAAPSSASDPPVSGDWTNITSAARDAAVTVTNAKAALQVVATAANPSPATVYFDGFNIATTAVGTTYNVDLQAISTPSPILVRGNAKPLSTASTPVPALARSTGKPLSAASTPSPALVRSMVKSLLTSSTPVPTMTRAKQTVKSLLTTSAPIPTLVKSTGKPLSTSSAPVAALARSTGKSLATATTPAPALSRAMAKALSAASTPAPSLTRSTGKSFQGSATPAPTLLRSTSKGLQTTSTPVPSLVNGLAYTKSLLATSTPVPTLTRRTSKTTQGTSTPAPSLVRAFGKLLLTTTAPVPTLAAQRVFVKNLQASTGGIASGSAGPRVSAFFYRQ